MLVATVSVSLILKEIWDTLEVIIDLCIFLAISYVVVCLL